ncbi:hypothetical protein BH24CHL6_BH24CHL6_12880 [soil metagenome]
MSSNAALYVRGALLLLCLVAFLALAWHQPGWPLWRVDAAVFTLQRDPALDLLMALASGAGGEEALAFLTAALMTALIYRGSRRAAIFLGIGLTVGNLASAGLKWFFDRPRPPIDYQPRAKARQVV